jgi:purine-binding chemotaxis protein CheW
MKRQIATFYLGETLLGIDILLVREINRHVHLSPIPDAPPQLLGLMNLRGRVVTVIDLNVCLNRPPADGIGATRLLILKTREEIMPFTAKGQLPDIDVGDDIVGFIIDRMDDVVAVEDNDILPPPPNVVGIRESLIQGVIKLENRLIILLDAPAVLADVTAAAG